MNFNWTREPDKAITLRAPTLRNAPFIHISRTAKGLKGYAGEGFVATLLSKAKLPSSGPYEALASAMKWGEKMVSKDFPKAVFGPLSKETKR